MLELVLEFKQRGQESNLRARLTNANSKIAVRIFTRYVVCFYVALPLSYLADIVDIVWINPKQESYIHN